MKQPRKIELNSFDGTIIYDCIYIADEVFPVIVVVQGEPNRAFYKTASRDKGKTGIYQECHTETILELDQPVKP